MTVTAELPTAHVNVDEHKWAEIEMDGVRSGFKVLKVVPETGEYVLYARFAPGSVVPVHRHFGVVHAFTMSGSWHYKEYDWVATAGSYVHETPASTHTLEVLGDEDAVILFVINGGLLLLDDDGQIMAYEDFETVQERYRLLSDPAALALAMQGLAGAGQ